MKRLKRFVCMALTAALLCSVLCVPALAAGPIMYGIGFVTADALRLRSQANTNSQVLDVATEDECVVVISKTGNWYKVIYNLETGYMHASYLSVLTRENAELGYGEVTGSAVNLRKGPGTGYGIVDVVTRGEECYIIGLNQGWYKVIYNGSAAYIRSDYLELTEYPYENADSPNSPKYFRLGKSIGTAVPGVGSGAWGNSGSGNNADSSNWDEENDFWGNNNPDDYTPSKDPWESSGPYVTGQDIVDEARKYLGTPYVYGGASPDGFDCSGLVYFVMKSLGYNPARTPADQYTHGSFVRKDNLQPGDLVFFSSDEGYTITHVGIYAGEGQFIHSPNSRSTVSYSDLTTGYWANTYYGARRITG